MVTTLPKGMGRLKATWFTEAVTHTLLECLRAAMLAARSIRASSSPPNKLLSGLVSPGNTRSVTTVVESETNLGSIFFVTNIHTNNIKAPNFQGFLRYF